jgi:hypothetical protein
VQGDDKSINYNNILLEMLVYFQPKPLVLTEFKNDKLPQVNKCLRFEATTIQQVYISVTGIGILRMFGTKETGPCIMRNFYCGDKC